MYICICKNVTDHQIRRAVYDGEIKSIRDLRQCLGATGQCGKCAKDARQIINSACSKGTPWSPSGQWHPRVSADVLVR